MAIQARKEACRRLREARRTVKQGETLRERWNTYKNKRRFVKKLIRKEKEMKKTLRKIKEQGEPSCKLFWSDLKGGHRNRKRSIPTLKSRIGKTIDEPMEVLEELARHPK